MVQPIDLSASERFLTMIATVARFIDENWLCCVADPKDASARYCKKRRQYVGNAAV